MKLKEIKSLYRKRLDRQYNEREADRLFFIFLEEIAGTSVTAFLSRQTEEISEQRKTKMLNALIQLQEGISYQHILGCVYFLDLKLKVSKAALVPRPETEELAQLIREKIPHEADIKIIDIGTGTGCLALSCAHYFKGAKVAALDISTEALELAKENAGSNQLHVEFHQCNFLKRENWPSGKWDLIVSNPPYIAEWESRNMDKLVMANDPWQALFVKDEDPLLFYRRICDFGRNQLADHGRIFLEINERLGEETKAIYTEAGFETVLLKDLSGKDRFVIANTKKPL